jgi:hypothetical protein
VIAKPLQYQAASGRLFLHFTTPKPDENIFSAQERERTKKHKGSNRSRRCLGAALFVRVFVGWPSFFKQPARSCDKRHQNFKMDTVHVPRRRPDLECGDLSPLSIAAIARKKASEEERRQVAALQIRTLHSNWDTARSAGGLTFAQ